MVSRSKKAFLNTTFELILEVVAAICNFILPRLILSHFGSTYNGITTSITQFIGYIALLKSGIGSVTRAALYKPLAVNDTGEISKVVNTTAFFMKKISALFLLATVVFSCIYSFIVIEDFEWLFTFTLVIIISLSTFSQYYFGMPYQMVLQADQRNYIISIVTIVTTILNTAVASTMILLGCSIHMVKLGSSVVFVSQSLFYSFWVRKKYSIDTSIKRDDGIISQRWDALGHQVANFINNNTDIIVITVILGVKEVSVYSVYHMISSAIYKVVTALITGTTAAFGNMMAKKEYDVLEKRFSQMELLIFFAATTLLSITAVLITPFVGVYTRGITDISYYRPIFGYLLCLAVYFMCLRLPYEQIVYAAGEFKRTKYGAYTEAGINIVLSVVLAYVLGIVGVIIGTIAACAYRTIRYHIFVCKNIIHRKITSILWRFAYSTAVCAVTFLVNSLFILKLQINSYLSWFMWAIPVSLFVILVSIAFSLIFFRKEFIQFLKLLPGVLRRKKG